MISKHTRRTARPQENTSKGVDGERAPTDTDTVCSAKNLIVNEDGSVSLRKPLKYVPSTVSRYEHIRKHLFDGIRVIEVGPSTFHVLTADNVDVNITLKYTEYTGEVQYLDASLYWSKIKRDAVEVLNLNNATILSGCSVNSKWMYDLGMLDSYKELDAHLPRYLKLYDDQDLGLILEIISPEVNTLVYNVDGSTPSFNPNLTADDPTAIRDTYDYALPSVKGIVAYSGRFENGGYLTSGNAEWETNNTNLELPVITTAGSTYPDYTTCDVTSSLDYEGSKRGELGLSAFYTEDYIRIRTYVNNINPVLAYVKMVLRYTVTDNAGNDAYTHSVEIVPKHATNSFSSYEYFKFDNPIDENASLSVVLESTWTFLRKEGWDPDKTYWTAPAVTVCNVTESNTHPITYNEAKEHYDMVSAFNKTFEDSNIVFLKAFCDMPASQSTYYATWETSSDGVLWKPLDTLIEYSEAIQVKELSQTWAPSGSVETPPSSAYTNATYYP